MGFTRTRKGKNGRVSYQACYYDERGIRQTAGTYATHKESEKAWQQAEARIGQGRSGDPRRAKQRFRVYVQDTWLPNHRMEASTRQHYTYMINAHIMPFFGEMRLKDITSETVRKWITHLKNKGVSAHQIHYCKTSILNAIFTTVFNDEILEYHPSRGVKTDPVPEHERQTITPEQFDLIYNALPTAEARLLIETDIESGLRWGELTELRVKDLDATTRILNVRRVVMELVRKHHPDGKRFLIKQYPKSKHRRRLKLSPQIVAKLKAHIAAENLQPDDLLFARRRDTTPPPALELVTPETHTFTTITGRTYTHGTMAAYNAGKCKCDRCRRAYADYRAKRRAQGKDNPRNPRMVDDDPHVPAGWFRRKCWHPARDAAGLDWSPRIHDLRHAHASWLLAGGADLQVVKERMGHRRISTTERYLHTLPNSDETALEALSKIRTIQADQGSAGLEQELAEAQTRIAELQTIVANQLIAQNASTNSNLRPA